MRVLHSYIDLEDRHDKSLSFWKGCHVTLYSLAAMFGILNSYFLYRTLDVFHSTCILDPNRLVFTQPELVPEEPPRASPPPTTIDLPPPVLQESDVALVFVVAPPCDHVIGMGVCFLRSLFKFCRQSLWRVRQAWTETTTTPSSTHAPAPPLLDIPASQFHVWSYCDLPLSTPLLAAVVALVWVAMFLMCPAGGRASKGLSRPWRVLSPALLCSLVLLLISGYNFVTTNSGLLAFCAHFRNLTDTDACTSAMDAYVVHPAGALSASAGVALSRAASAACFACWAVAAALLLARAVAGADFAVSRTEVRLVSPKKTPPQRRQRRQVRIGEGDIRTAAPTDVISVENGVAQPTPSTSGGVVGTPSTSGGVVGAPSTSGGVVVAPSSSGGVAKTAPHTSGAQRAAILNESMDSARNYNELIELS